MIVERCGSFFRWLGTPFRAVRGWFPFSSEGRQTLVYLVFAGAGPMTTLLVWWAMNEAFKAHQWPLAGALANKVAWGLLILICGLACFVSIRAVKVGKDGLDVQGFRNDDAATRAAVDVANAAVDKAVEIAKPGDNNGGNDGTSGV